jgi:hypothetical protein
VAKAVDCLNNKIMLVKLHFCGIRGVFADWLRSYLICGNISKLYGYRVEWYSQRVVDSVLRDH